MHWKSAETSEREGKYIRVGLSSWEGKNVPSPHKSKTIQFYKQSFAHVILAEGVLVVSNTNYLQYFIYVNEPVAY